MKYNNANIENSVLGVLRQTLGFDVVGCTFVPVGEESYAFSVVVSDGSKYFVKYCDKQKIIKSIDVVNALLLQLKEFDFVVPPIEIGGKTSFEVGSGKIYVYPYIEGSVVRMGNDKFDKELVDKLTEILVKIHSTNPKILTDLPKEDFENNYDPELKHIPDEKNFRLMIETQNLVATEYRQKRPELVLTHGDVTGLNIIITNQGDIKLVDWDGAMLAPAERDFNFLYDNPNFSLDKYMQLSGHKVFDLKLKEYYSRQWDLDCIVEDSMTLGESNLETLRES